MARVPGSDYDPVDIIVSEHLVRRRGPLEAEPGGGVGRRESPLASHRHKLCPRAHETGQEDATSERPCPQDADPAAVRDTRLRTTPGHDDIVLT